MLVTPPNTAWERLGNLIPESLHLLNLLGEPITPAYVIRFTQSYGNDWLASLLDKTRAPENFADIWRTVMSRPSWEPLELMLAEHWISVHPSTVAASLPEWMNLEKTLHTVRSRVASYLYDQAKSVNWREPLTFMRALKVAEVYLAGVVENIDYTATYSQKSLYGKLGAARVLQTRYEMIGVTAITYAVEHLEKSIQLGNVQPEALGYLAAARLSLFDESKNIAHLRAIVRLIGEPKTQLTPNTQLIIAESWLRLAEVSESSSGRTQFLAKARDLAKPVMEFGNSALERVHATLIWVVATFNAGAAQALPIAGLRLPFGLRQRVAAWGEGNRQAACQFLNLCVECLLSTQGSYSSDPILRRVIAQCTSLHADLLGEYDGELLHRHKLDTFAINARQGSGTRPLTDPESSLENVLDLFSIHAIERRDITLLRATLAAVETALSDPTWATPVLILARELTDMQSAWPPAAEYQLGRTENVSRDRDLLAAVISRDTRRMYAISARRALSSREIGRRSLGGRVGVFLAEDYSGSLNDQFVFKPTLSAVADYDDQRTKQIAGKIEQHALTDRFGVGQTLARSPLPEGDSLREANCDVIVAKTFHSGRLLGEIGRATSPSLRSLLFERAAEFLALIHSCNIGVAETKGSPRRDLKRKEFGRWLVSLQVPDPADVFESWWDALNQVPLLPRRDAHADNWIVTETQQLIALDFDAHGWRPLGYELAQLTDDLPLIDIDPAGWALRKRLVALYSRSLAKFGTELPTTSFLPAYELGIIARAVRGLTDPAGSISLRSHGLGLLEWLREQGSTPVIRHIAISCIGAWNARSASTVGAGDESRTIGETRRRHLSRAMTYQLRHGGSDSIQVDENGWMQLAQLSSLLNLDGHHTTQSELEVVAAAIDEHRYEVSGHRIRALYGHTIPVSLDYERVQDGRTLFHGTAFSNLNSIFSGAHGLLPGRRQWVHMSSDPVAAMMTARRHGPAVLLSVDTADLEGVYSAGGTVYLSRTIPTHALSIVRPLALFARGVEVAVV